MHCNIVNLVAALNITTIQHTIHYSEGQDDWLGFQLIRGIARTGYASLEIRHNQPSPFCVQGVQGGDHVVVVQTCVDVCICSRPACPGSVKALPCLQSIKEVSTAW